MPKENKSSPQTNSGHEICTDVPMQGSQITIVSTPAGYIRAGERLMAQQATQQSPQQKQSAK